MDTWVFIISLKIIARALPATISRMFPITPLEILWYSPKWIGILVTFLSLRDKLWSRAESVHWLHLLQFSHSVVSNSLWPHGLQHARLPCPLPTPGACSNSCLLIINSIKYEPCCLGPPRWTGHGREFWQNVFHWRRKWQTFSVFLPWEPHEQYEKQKDMTLKDELPRLVGAHCAPGEEWETTAERMKRWSQSQPSCGCDRWWR